VQQQAVAADCYLAWILNMDLASPEPHLLQVQRSVRLVLLEGLIHEN
jgi:hypothetical protein